MANRTIAVRGVDQTGRAARVRSSFAREQLVEPIASLPPCLTGVESGEQPVSVFYCLSVEAGYPMKSGVGHAAWRRIAREPHESEIRRRHYARSRMKWRSWRCTARRCPIHAAIGVVGRSPLRLPVDGGEHAQNWRGAMR